MAFANIASFLGPAAQARPNAPAIYVPVGSDRQGKTRYEHLTYGELDAKSNAVAAGLQAYGITRGMRTVLMVKPSLELFILTFGLFKAGVVPVMVDPGIGLKHLKACLGKAEPEAFIGIAPAHGARLLLGWAKETIKCTVYVGSPAPPGGISLAALMDLGSQAGGEIAPTDGRDVAAILFTSGSTGPPKGVIYRHENFCAQVDAIREMYQIEPGEVDLPTFPLFALFDPALGMTTVIPEMDATKPAHVDPTKIIGAIEQFGVTNMFGSPALLNRVGRYGEKHGVKLPSLRRVISAGAPVPTVVMERFAAMLGPKAQIVTPYGATESLPVASIGSHEVLGEIAPLSATGHGICVGHPVPTAKVEIIAITDKAIRRWSDARLVPQGQVGEIVVHGPQVTEGYFNAPHKTALAKIYDSETRAVRHRMGDLGYLDKTGRLWFCGRKAHRVETPAGPLFSVKVESVFNGMPDVFRAALVGVGPKGNQEAVLCIEQEPKSQLSWPKLRQAVRQRAKQFPECAGIQHILNHPGFPVDIRHNAKIGREKLAVWAQKELA